MLIYRIFSVILFPFLEIYLFYRILKQKEDKKRLKERFGKPTIARPDGEVIWLHAVSVGEVNSSFILIENLLANNSDSKILITSTTLTSAQIIAKKQQSPNFKNRIIHQFLPIDSYYCVKDFINFWQPKMALFVESEIWPNLLNLTKKSQIPLFLINGRMSQKSAKNWLIAYRLFFRPFRNFTAIFAQTSDDQKRLAKLTKKDVKFLGNLKAQSANLDYDANKLEELKQQITTRKFWIAASTHKGEEQIIIETHKILKEKFSDILTIIIPRHPNRADEITQLMADINYSQRSKNQKITSQNEIYLADSLNEMGIFYRLTNFAFIGGSLVEVGGHNPFEPLKLNCNVISGPHIFNFKDIYQSLEQNQACLIVNNAKQLADSVGQFLTDENLAKNLSEKSLPIINQNDNISQKIIDMINLKIL